LKVCCVEFESSLLKCESSLLKFESSQEFIEQFYKIPNRSRNPASIPAGNSPAPQEFEDVDTDDIFSDSYSDQGEVCVCVCEINLSWDS